MTGHHTRVCRLVINKVHDDTYQCIFNDNDPDTDHQYIQNLNIHNGSHYQFSQWVDS